MAEEFLHLEQEERSQILRGLTSRLQRSAAVLEKDVWVCWVLQTLFALPNHLPMAFKGGTSLSKVFGLIDRFSEDVDVTIDYRGLDEDADPFAQGISRNKLRQLGERLKADVREHVYHEVVPYFKQQLANQFNPESYRITVDDAGEKLRVYYQSAVAPDSYLKTSVLLEFGGRNIVEPNEQHTIRPDIAPYLTELFFPEANVNVLSPARTFWEKATLIHVECNRNEFRSTPERLSRHWYDLAILVDNKVGETALNDIDLLEDVIKLKQAFFYSRTASYDDCLKGKFRLLPRQTALGALRNDYQQMINAGMFIGAPLAFEQIVERIAMLENRINSIFAE